MVYFIQSPLHHLRFHLHVRRELTKHVVRRLMTYTDLSIKQLTRMAGHEVKTYTAADIGLQTGRQSRCAIEVRNCTSTHCIPHVTNRHRLFHICIYLQGVSKNKLARVLRFLIHHHRRRCHHVHFERLKMCAAYNEYCALPTKRITRSFSSCSLVFDRVSVTFRGLVATP